jgi:hypothetical protein
MTFRKSYGGTGIVISVKKAPQEQKKQEFGGFLQEYATLYVGTRRICIKLFYRIRETLGRVKITILLTQSRLSMIRIQTIFYCESDSH